MRSSAIILALATAVYADIPGLPKCAQSCVTSFGDCNPIDVACICKAGGLITNLSCCVSKQCDADGQKAVIKFADSICAPYNSNLPTAASCASTAAATSAPASSSSSEASASSSSMSMTSGATAATTTGGAASSSAGSSGAESSGTNTPASTTSQTGSTSATNAAASSSSAPAGNGANSLQGMGLGMVLAGVVAAL